jgi:hypothetical protein
MMFFALRSTAHWIEVQKSFNPQHDKGVMLFLQLHDELR